MRSAFHCHTIVYIYIANLKILIQKNMQVKCLISKLRSINQSYNLVLRSSVIVLGQSCDSHMALCSPVKPLLL